MAGQVFVLLVFMVTSIVVACLPMEPAQLRVRVLTAHLIVTVAAVAWLFIPDGDDGTIPLALVVFGPGAAIAIVRIARTRRELGQRND